MATAAYSVSSFKTFVTNNTHIVYRVVGAGALIGAALYAYNHYQASQEQQALLAYVECVHEFKQALSTDEHWDIVALAAQTGYDKFSRTDRGPLFLVLKAQGLVKQGNLDEAVTTLQDALSHMNSNSLMYSSIALLKSRVQLDSANQELQQAGLRELQTLAMQKNLVQDQALYYLGEYYDAHGQKEDANKTFTTLVQSFNEQGSGSSPWAELVKQRVG